MISYTISSKTTKESLEDCEVTDTTNIKKIINKCKEFNKKLSSDVYISKVFTNSSDIKYTYFLDFKVKTLKPVRLRGKEHSVLGSDPFNCDYLIPLENENG
jgi:hypothetical protein|tara:strand:+ start:181 stop:483 length:303 start_codon:yes stop_codon:yes gene_type:complete